MQYRLVRSPRRRLSTSLQVNGAGEVIVRAPRLMPKFMIDRFVAEHQSWIAKRRAELERPKAELTPHFASLDTLHAYVKEQLVKYQAIMGLTPTRLRFTNVRSYWGSCSPTGVISFNNALRFVPREAVTYIVVHELAHLRWRGHGQRFWDLVNKTYPDTPAIRKILRSLPRSI